MLLAPGRLANLPQGEVTDATVLETVTDNYFLANQWKDTLLEWQRWYQINSKMILMEMQK